MANGRRRKRTARQREQDLVLEAALYVRGVPYREIAKRVGVRSQSTIENDVALIRKRWRESQLTMIDEHIGRQLALIDAREMEAWAAWEASKESTVRTTSRRVVGPEKREVSIVSKDESEHVGDPRFLATLAKCVDQRIDLLGLSASNRRGLDWEEMRRYARAIADASGEPADALVAEVEEILRSQGFG